MWIIWGNADSDWWVWVSLRMCKDAFFFFFNVYLFLRQRETEHERGRSERGWHRIWNRLQALSCQHKAQRGARTHGPWDRDLSRSRPLNRLSHPGAPASDSWFWLRSWSYRVRGNEPHVRLCTDSMEPAWDSLSPCLSLLLPNSHSLPLKINLKKKEIRSSNI